MADTKENYEYEIIAKRYVDGLENILLIGKFTYRRISLTHKNSCYFVCVKINDKVYFKETHHSFNLAFTDTNSILKASYCLARVPDLEYLLGIRKYFIKFMFLADEFDRTELYITVCHNESYNNYTTSQHIMDKIYEDNTTDTYILK